MTIAQPIVSGDLILSLASPNEVDEYTPQGQYVQTLIDGSDGLCLPTGSAFDAVGNLYVTDFSCNQIFKLDTTGTISVFANNTTLASASMAFDAPESIALDPNGTLMYVSNANRNSPGGGIDVLDASTGAGLFSLPLPSSQGSDGQGESDWLAFSSEGLLFMTNENAAQGVMQVDIGTGDIVSPSFASDAIPYPYALSFDKNGDLWLADTSMLLEYDSSGSLLQTVENPAFSSAFAAVFDPSGTTLYVGDLGNGNVYVYDHYGDYLSGFGTPSGGIDGISVAGNPLITGGVDSALSTVNVSPTSIAADGVSQAEVTVTLRDANNNPVAGKTVNIISSRGRIDAIQQPAGPTDASGQAVAEVRSTQPGTAILTARDVADNLTIDQQGALVFVLSSSDLVRSIQELQNQADSDMTGGSASLSAVAQQLAQDGDAMVAASAADTIGLITTIMSSASDIVEAGSPDGTGLSLPGLGDQAWTHILEFDEASDPERTIFNDAFQTAAQSGDLSGLTNDVLLQGLQGYAAKAKNEAISQITQDAALEAVQNLIQTSTNWMSTGLLPAAQSRATLLQGDLDQVAQHTIAALPSFSNAESVAWEQDLAARTDANIEEAYYQQLLANTIHTLRIDHDTGSANPALEAILRAGGKALSYGLAPLGPVAYAGALGGFDTALAEHKLQESGETASLALGGLNSIPNTLIAMHQNTVNGLIALAAGQSPDTASGTIADVGDQSVQTCHAWHLICNEQSSSSQLQVTNTGSDQAFFVVNAQYTTQGGTLGIYPLGEIATGSAVVNPGQTVTIPVVFKNGTHGSSPTSGSTVTFDLEVANKTGTFLVDHTYTTWAPQVITANDQLGTAHLAHRAVSDETSSPAPDLVSGFAVADPSTNSYEIQLWVNNPLTQSVTAKINQAVPAGLAITAIGSDGTQSGSNVIWTTIIPAQTSQDLTMTVQLVDPTTGAQTLPGASADLIDGTNNDSGTLMTDPLTLAPLTVLQLMSGLSGQILPGTALTVPYTVTNISPTAVSGTLAVTLTATGGAILYTAQQPIAVGADSATVATVTLPASLPLGPLTEDVSVTGAGMSPATTTNAAIVGNPLPLITFQAPPSPAPFNSVLTYTVSLTNTTAQPLVGTALAVTVTGAGSLLPGSVSVGGSVSGNTVSWAIPDPIAPGASLTESLAVQPGSSGSVTVQAEQSAQDMLPQVIDASTTLLPGATETVSPTPSDTPESTSTDTPTAVPTTPIPTDSPTTMPTATTPANTFTPTTTPIPPTNTPLPPALPTSTRPALPTAVPPAPTATSTPRTAGLIPFTLKLSPRRVVSGKVLTVQVNTAPKAPVSLTLQVVAKKTVVTGKGKHRKRVTRTTVLYKLQRHGVAGAKGHYVARLRITYKPHTATRASVVATARLSHRPATRTSTVTIQPAPHRKKKR